MDLLFKRYASPFSLLDIYVGQGRLLEFVDAIIEITAEEKQWNFFLHKVFDKSYDDFRSQYAPRVQQKPVDFEATIKHSADILSNFVPQ